MADLSGDPRIAELVAILSCHVAPDLPVEERTLDAVLGRLTTAEAIRSGELTDALGPELVGRVMAHLAILDTKATLDALAADLEQLLAPHVHGTLPMIGEVLSEMPIDERTRAEHLIAVLGQPPGIRLGRVMATLMIRP